MSPLVEHFDCLLLDLDGTVYRGAQPIAGAADALTGVDAALLYVTNNASLAPQAVAAQLTDLGFLASVDDVVTSAQSAARLLAERLAPGAAVLIVGTDALADEVGAAGLRPVRSFDDQPEAVVQGHSPDTCWAQLGEAALAIRAGAWWVAANVDRTLPTERGLLPGNGAMVAALAAATDATPQVAGKPAPVLLADALSRGDFDAPLVVGDRLDTDIGAAVAAELPSLLVLTGVSTVADFVAAPATERPTYLGADLRALHEPPDALRVAKQPAWHVEVADHEATVTSAGPAPDDPLAVVRAVAHAVWQTGERPWSGTVRGGDDAATSALQNTALPMTADE